VSVRLAGLFVGAALAIALPGSFGVSAASDVERTVKVGGRARSYILHVPPRLGSGPAPLVLAFHGGATNARSMVRLTGLNGEADREQFVLAYPNGSGRLPSVLTWNAGRCCGYAADRKEDDVAFVREMLDDIPRVVPIDTRRVYATGISNGGQMAYRLAAEMPDRIAAIAPVAASLEVDLTPLSQPVALLHFHGTADEHLPFSGGRGQRSMAGITFTSVDRSLAAWISTNGCGKAPAVDMLPDRFDDGTRVERRTYRGCRNNADVVLYLIHGGGHTWPGQPRGEFLLGVASREISATNVMWQFFRSHRR
jgi:polyhydroxybutyrate depolymerase